MPTPKSFFVFGLWMARSRARAAHLDPESPSPRSRITLRALRVNLLPLQRSTDERPREAIASRGRSTESLSHGVTESLLARPVRIRLRLVHAHPMPEVRDV